MVRKIKMNSIHCLQIFIKKFEIENKKLILHTQAFMQSPHIMCVQCIGGGGGVGGGKVFNSILVHCVFLRVHFLGLCITENVKYFFAH